MSILDRITVGLGFGLFYGISYEWLNPVIHNMTLGLHAQEWNAKELNDKEVDLHELYIGLFFIRFIIQFVK